VDFVTGNGRNGLRGSGIDGSDTVMLSFNVKVEGRVRFVSSLTATTDVVALTHLGVSCLLFDFDARILKRVHF